MGEPVDTSAKAVERVALTLERLDGDGKSYTLDKLDEAADLLRAMSRELQSLRAQCARVQRDADRYAWLRSDGMGHINFADLTPDTCDIGLDHAIDAAMAAKGDDWLAREARQIGLHSPACASVRFGQNECDCGAKP